MKSTALRLTALFCAALALGGCAARVEMVPPVATAAHPRVVELTTVSMIQPGLHFIANGTVAARDEYPLRAYHDGRLHGLPALQQRVTPTPARWSVFWRVVDRLDLAAWKPEYDQGDLPVNRNGDHVYTTDGLQWMERLSTPGHTRTAKGDGAFPIAGRPLSTTVQFSPESRNAVLTLESAFAELLKP